MRLSVIGRWNTERSLFTVGRILWGKGGIECDRKGYRAKFSLTLRRRFRADVWREYDGWLADLGWVRLHYKWDRVAPRYEPTGTDGGAWGYDWIRRVK
jgi:hypothetical protein